MKLTAADLAKLQKAHPDLRRFVMALAATTHIPFAVLEVTRTVAQQRKNIANHVSWTMKSRHLASTDGLARAADLVPLVNGKKTWAWPVYYDFAAIAKQVAQNIGLNVPGKLKRIEWGGDWSKNKDGPHWQLSWKLYP